MSLLNLSKVRMPLFHPDTPITGGTAASGTIEDKSLDKESVIELLGEDDKPETIELDEGKKKGKEDKEARSAEEDKEGDDDSEEEAEDSSEEEKELSLEDELEDELEEPDEEKLELLEAPRRKEILAKYPNVFKDFPQLEKAMYRERAYSEILPTIEDARTVVSRAKLLDNYENEIMNGSTESLLSVVKDNDKEAFAKVVDNYLPVLHKVDANAYFHTIGNVIKHTIASMVREGKSQEDDELATAAAVLNNFIFGTTKFTPPQNLSKSEIQDGESREKSDSISRREVEFRERQYTVAKEDLGTKVDNVLKATVDKAIDPNSSMTEYIKKTATREVLEGLDKSILKDTRFRAIYDKLWERAFEKDYDKESMDRIKSAYLSKAKTLLPLLIKQARNEALKGIKRSSNDDKDRKGPLPVGRTRSSTTLASGRASSNSAKSIPRGVTTLEYLNSDD